MCLQLASVKDCTPSAFFPRTRAVGALTAPIQKGLLGWEGVKWLSPGIPQCAQRLVWVMHTAAWVLTPLPGEGLGELPARRAHTALQRTGFRLLPARGPGVKPCSPVLSMWWRLGNGMRVVKMKALILAAAGAMLLSPTFCQSGKLFPYGGRWGCGFVLWESTESTFLFVSHKLHPKRQSLTVVVKRWYDGNEQLQFVHSVQTLSKT